MRLRILNKQKECSQFIKITLRNYLFDKEIQIEKIIQIPVKLNEDIQLFNKIDKYYTKQFNWSFRSSKISNGLRYTHHETILLINTYDKDWQTILTRM